MDDEPSSDEKDDQIDKESAGEQTTMSLLMDDGMNLSPTVKIYPNPNKGQLTLRWIGAIDEMTQLVIINSVGQTIHIQRITDIETSLQIRKLVPGTYQARMIYNEGIMTIPFIVID